jgi:hypothetical protein
MIPQYILRAFPLFVLLAMSPPANADWINLTGSETAANIAEIYVMDDHVKLVLEVYVGDLEVFEDLVPDAWLNQKSADQPDEAARIRRFAEERFQFITGSGEKLPAEVVLIEPRQRVNRRSAFAGMINPYTRQRVPEAPADKRVLYAELRYPFDGKPGELTMVPPRDAEGHAEATIGFIVYHKSVPVIDFRYLGAPAKLKLDWEDPWYSKFDNPNLKRHHKSALMSFLYVEPYEVRHEILTRVRDLEEWMDLGLRGDEYIEIDELEPLRQRIGDFLLSRNPVLVDGKALKPILDRMNYVKVALTGIQLVETPERMEISTAIVGVIITYLTDGMPQEVTVDWDLFTDQVQRVPATATDPAGPLPTFLTPDDNVHQWTNFLKNYQLPTVQEIAVSDELTRKPVPLVSLFFLLGLVPVAGWLHRRKTRGQALWIPATVGVVLLAGTAAAFPFYRVGVPVPGALAPTMSNDQARLLLTSLLKNVYRAFDFREEEDVYDKLAFSVSGDLLNEIYLQNRKSFAVKKAGGAQARVKEVEILDLDVQRAEESALAHDFKARWTAMGTVGHWGHTHIRKNLYEARIRVEAEAGNWSITGLELLDEQRIDPATGQLPASIDTSQK